MAGGAGAGVVHGAGLTRPGLPTASTTTSFASFAFRTPPTSSPSVAPSFVSPATTATLGQFQQRNIVIVVIVVVIVIIIIIILAIVLIVCIAVVAFASTVASTTTHIDVRAYVHAYIRALDNQWRLRG